MLRFHWEQRETPPLLKELICNVLVLLCAQAGVNNFSSTRRRFLSFQSTFVADKHAIGMLKMFYATIWEACQMQCLERDRL